MPVGGKSGPEVLRTGAHHGDVDDLVIATSASPPPNVDGSGNAVIGSWPE